VFITWFSITLCWLNAESLITNPHIFLSLSCSFLLVAGWQLSHRRFLPPWESQNVHMHYQKCTFRTSKNSGHLASRTKFCRTLALLWKYIKWGPRRKIWDKWDPYVQGGSNMTGTICVWTSHSLSRSYLNHLLCALALIHAYKLYTCPSILEAHGPWTRVNLSLTPTIYAAVVVHPLTLHYT
jgi:hypothetical protein